MIKKKRRIGVVYKFTNTPLARRLTQLREESGLSSGEVAIAVGVHYTSWSGYEIGRCQPSEGTLKQVSGLFGVDVQELVRLKEQSKEMSGNANAVTQTGIGVNGTQQAIISGSVFPLLVATQNDFIRNLKFFAALEGRAQYYLEKLDKSHRGSYEYREFAARRSDVLYEYMGNDIPKEVSATTFKNAYVEQFNKGYELEKGSV